MQIYILSRCFELKLMLLTTVSNLFSNLSNTKMATLATLCVLWKNSIKPVEQLLCKISHTHTLDRYKMFNIDCICSGIFHYTTKEFDE